MTGMLASEVAIEYRVDFLYRNADAIDRLR